jgi:hypothetical protein
MVSLTRLSFAVALLVFPAAQAQERSAPESPRQAIVCRDCGIVSNIRRVERAVAPERKLLPDLAATPREGVSGSATQAVPLFVFDAGRGASFVRPQPVSRSSWEVTIRYDNGSFGFVTVDAEPEFAVGDRVRLGDNIIEPIPGHR